MWKHSSGSCLFDSCDVLNDFTPDEDQHLYLHITSYAVDASSLCSLLFPPFPFFSSSSIIQPWQLLLSSGSSDPAALWPSLASLWLPGHGTACTPGPSFAHNSRCGHYWASSVSSEGYKDSGSALSNFSQPDLQNISNPASSCSQYYLL